MSSIALQRIVLSAWLLATALVCQAAAQTPGADELVTTAIAHHDPLETWSTGSFRLELEESRPDGSVRKTTVGIDNKASRFELESEREGRRVSGRVSSEECAWQLDGKTDFSDDEREEFQLTCERLKRTRDYYTFLWGMPMKLQDPGTLIGDEVKTVDFQGQESWEVRVTYAEDVGSDIWYFYISPENRALVGYRFYHDEAANDGEYITLEGLQEGAGLRLPRQRAWYMHQDDEFLGTDTLISISPWRSE